MIIEGCTLHSKGAPPVHECPSFHEWCSAKAGGPPHAYRCINYGMLLTILKRFASQPEMVKVGGGQGWVGCCHIANHKP